ncbi:probable cytochrome P450 313a4 isoform X1 [Glossina fuscipes]|uniref:Probable cytochrome P450 313a4 isoform X1 n=1 Tax=Glossina fuscipes TaxID=7396 RepID=A0A9C5ZDH3_9MUSC|nr:probable cytochrome P450 313a4 isoform X1 [Glossina fuscipes]
MQALSLYFTLITLLWIYWLWTRRKFYSLFLKLRGPLGYPFIGMAHHLIRREEVLSKLNVYNKMYGPVWCSWVGPYPFVVISDPVIAQEVLLSPNCVNKCFIYDGLDYTVGSSLFSLKEPRWSVHRKIFNPAFNHKILLSFIPLFNEEVDALVLTLDKYAGNGPVDLMQTMQTYTLCLATRTTMGGMSINRDHFEKTLVQSYQSALENTADVVFSPWLKCEFLQRMRGKQKKYSSARMDINHFIRKLVNAQLSINDSDERSPDNSLFIDIAIENFKCDRFTRTNVDNECGAIVFGQAFETTANSIVYTLMLLAMFPNCQEKVYEELLSEFPETGNVNITYNNTQNLIYMDMVLNETMRVLAPVPLVARETMNDIKLSNGVTLPSGVQIAIDIFNMHRRKDIWGPEAETFNPDNFLSTNLQNKHSYAFIPFTKGLRYCIGWKYALLSTKITLAKLLRNYKFTTDFKFEHLKFVEDITLKLQKLPLFTIERRDE